MGKYLSIIILLYACTASVALSNDKPEKKEMNQTIYDNNEAKKIAEEVFLKKLIERLINIQLRM
jgi:hypothetical protein